MGEAQAEEDLHEFTDDLKYYPIGCSSTSLSFDPAEKVILDNLRRWSVEYLKNNQIYPCETNIQSLQHYKNGVPFFKDFDLIGKLTAIKLLDDRFADVQIKDLAGKVFSMRLDRIRSKIPSHCEVVRVRSALLKGVDQLKRKGNQEDPIEVEFSNHTNILHIPYYFKQALLLNDRIIEDDTLRKLIIGTDNQSNEILSSP